MHLPLFLLVLLVYLVEIGCRPLVWRRPMNGCGIPLYVLNQLVASTIQEEGFGVEPVIGLGTQEGVDPSSSVQALIKIILRKNSTYSSEQLQPCVEALLHPVKPVAPPGSNFVGPVSQVDYTKPWYLGGVTAIGVPVPDDDEYIPGSEGYTTYINPYNFLQKYTNYTPSAFFLYTDRYKLVFDAVNKLTNGVGQAFSDYGSDLASIFPIDDVLNWFK